MQKNSKKIAVVYHGDCPDGFSGAWAARKKLGNKAEYIPASDRHNPPEGLEGREVYLIDFTYAVPVMEKLKLQAKRLVAIDHHISQQESVKVAHEHSFALNHSGAVLAWEYFNPKKKMPKLLNYVEDYDIWNFRHSASMPVHALIESTSFTFKNWDKLAADLDKPATAKRRISEGKIVLGLFDKILERLLGYAEKVVFEGFEIMAVNSPVLNDQLGNILCKKHPPLAIVWRKEHNHIHVSLRSDGSVDVSKLAAKFGGAGHRAASGFSLGKDQPLPWRPAKK